jgi:predicted amidohydrolase YtcJ
MICNGKADIVLYGASFYSAKQDLSKIDFVAVSGNKICGLGSDKDMDKFIGPYTYLMHYSKDQLIMPGLHDNHVHLIISGMIDKYIDLTDSKSEADAAKTVAEFAKTIPDEEWILGAGWCRMSWNEKKMPTKSSLDALIPDRPVFLLDSEMHGAWVNSKALSLCNITSLTVDPEFGTISKGLDGEPDGYLYETALCLVGKQAFNFDKNIVKDLIRRYMNKAIRWGITSVSDMTPYMDIALDYEDIYREMGKNQELIIRVNAAKNLLDNLDEVSKGKRLAETDMGGMYRIPYVKQFIDGVPTNYTAQLLEDYSDKPGERGGMLINTTVLEDTVAQAHRCEISVRLHACGDGAVRKAMDAIEKAIVLFGKNKCRHQIEHIEVIDPGDIGRFKKLGIIASVQPEHLSSGIPAFDDNCYPSRLGSEREKYTWAFKSLKNSGAVLAGGSDAPVVEGNPFHGIYSGLTRIYADKKPEGGWNPQERLSIEDILEMYTYGAAYAEIREHELGTLDKGKLADIIVLDRNLLCCSADEIPYTQVLLTMVNGKIVFSR